MNICMILSDSCGYKTYLDLLNYAKFYGFDDININYFIMPELALIDIKYSDEFQIPICDHSEARFFEKFYKLKDKNVFMLYRNAFVVPLINILKNYINNQPLLSNNANNCNISTELVYFTNINRTGNIHNADEIELKFNTIPKADLYLFSARDSRNGSIAVQLACSMFLIKKFGADVIVGGGSHNSSISNVPKLINKIGETYFDGKLKYKIGDIGATVYNYINNTNNNIYNKFTDLTELVDLNLDSQMLQKKIENKFVVAFSHGCVNSCPYCSGSKISKYSIHNDLSLFDKWFYYLKTNFPDTTIEIFDNEINPSINRIVKILEYLIKHKIRNPINFYINNYYINDEIISLLKHINVGTLYTSIDCMFDDIKFKHNSSKNDFDNIISKLHSNVHNLIIDLVANPPIIGGGKYINDPLLVKLYLRYLNIIEYNEFGLAPSSDMAANPNKYGLNYIYFKYNDINILSNISKELYSVPILYSRSDIDRADLVNMKHNLLNVLNKYINISSCIKTQNDILYCFTESVHNDSELVIR